MYGYIVLRILGVVPILEISKWHVLFEHGIGPTPRREFFHFAAEGVAHVSSPIFDLNALTT